MGSPLDVPGTSIAAELAIRGTLARYCRAMDRMDDDLALTLFTPDARVNYEPDMFTGLARDFVPWVHTLHEGFETTVHRLSTITVDVAEDTAASEAYGHVLLLERDARGTHLRHGYGRYVDEWRRREGLWRIAHREYRRDLGYTEAVDAAPAAGRRDRSDFSYRALSG